MAITVAGAGPGGPTDSVGSNALLELFYVQKNLVFHPVSPPSCIEIQSCVQCEFAPDRIPGAFGSSVQPPYGQAVGENPRPLPSTVSFRASLRYCCPAAACC